MSRYIARWLPALLVFTTAFSASAQRGLFPGQRSNANLTGSWRDDRGRVSLVRQVDNDVCWYAESRPNGQEVFCGVIDRNIITGQWMDMPGSRQLTSGQLTLRVESNNRIVKVRPDKKNPRSRGYACRKGLNIAYFQHHAQRLTHPLKKVDGAFQQISWDQALDEIAGRLRAIIDEHGPRALAYVGGGGQGSHFQAAFAVRLLHALGSQYHYSPLAQELTGNFWAQGRVLGRQYLFTVPDHAAADLMLAIGWNGWMSHQMPQARRWFEKIARDRQNGRDPHRLLIVVDPHQTETTRLADIHLALRHTLVAKPLGCAIPDVYGWAACRRGKGLVAGRKRNGSGWGVWSGI